MENITPEEQKGIEMVVWLNDNLNDVQVSKEKALEIW